MSASAVVRTIRFIVLTLALLPVLFVVLVVVTRMRGPTEQQQAALELLKPAMPPVKGRDGSDAMWLLGRDVPEAQQAEVAADTRRYLDQAVAVALERGQPEADKLVDPRSRFPEFAAMPSGSSGLCIETTAACLAQVRADRGAVASTLRQNEAGLRSALSFPQHDGVRYGVAVSLQQVLPKFSSQRWLVRMHFASLFADGKQDEALSGLCDDIAGWRRIGGNTDILVGSMVGAAYARQDLMLLSEMLAEMPMDAPLPAACEAALAPTEDYELDVCPAMRSEFRLIESVVNREMSASAENPSARAFLKAAVDSDHVLAVAAPSYAQYCDGRLLQAARQDKPSASIGLVAANCQVFDRLADPIGCYLAEASENNNRSGYADRRTDLAAALALMRTVLWLRAQSVDTSTWPDWLRQRPASLGLRRQPTISGDGKRISIPLLDKSRDPAFSLVIQP